jgi:uncharacterized protein
MITEDIKKLVECECSNVKNALGSSFFKQHILIVKEFACTLAEILGADREIVEISSYLHDISAVMDINTLSRHPDLSAETAELILKDKSYDPKKIKEVRTVIKSHSVPVKIGKGTLEEVCVSNADAISQIASPTSWLFFAFSVRKMGYEQRIEWYVNKIGMNMDTLIKQARDLAGDKYCLAKSLIEF